MTARSIRLNWAIDSTSATCWFLFGIPPPPTVELKTGEAKKFVTKFRWRLRWPLAIGHTTNSSIPIELVRTHSGGDNPLHVVFGSVFISIFFCISALNFGLSVTNICHHRIRTEHDAFGKPHEQNNWIYPVIYLGRNGICQTISYDNRRPQSKCLAS